jgi:hypothetical protein
MGLNVSPDLFEEKMSKLFADLPHVRAFFDDLLIWTNGTYKQHLEKVHQVLD